MKFRLFIFSLICIIAAQSAFAEADAPFGLAWGMTKADVTRLGVILEPHSAHNGIEILKTSKLPKNLSIAEGYALSLDGKHNLQRIQMLSKNIDNDPTGRGGKNKYADLKKSLINKYGQPTFGTEKVGVKLWDEADEFYQCLAYSGCGMWASGWELKESGLTILLQLKGLGRGNGYIDLTYEGPKWSDIVDAVDARKAKADENAL